MEVGTTTTIAMAQATSNLASSNRPTEAVTTTTVIALATSRAVTPIALATSRAMTPMALVTNRAATLMEAATSRLVLTPTAAVTPRSQAAMAMMIQAEETMVVAISNHLDTVIKVMMTLPLAALTALATARSPRAMVETTMMIAMDQAIPVQATLDQEVLVARADEVEILDPTMTTVILDQEATAARAKAEEVETLDQEATATTTPAVDMVSREVRVATTTMTIIKMLTMTNSLLLKLSKHSIRT